MTALERAEQIAARWRFGAFGGKEEMRDAIHRAIIEHSNAELERRRKVEAWLHTAVDALAAIERREGQCARCGRGGCDAACKELARRALKALEGGNGM